MRKLGAERERSALAGDCVYKRLRLANETLAHGQQVGGASPHLSLFCNVASKEGNEPGVARALIRTLFHAGKTTRRGPIFTKQSQRTKCIVTQGVICDGCFTQSFSLYYCCDSLLPPCYFETRSWFCGHFFGVGPVNFLFYQAR